MSGYRPGQRRVGALMAIVKTFDETTQTG